MPHIQIQFRRDTSVSWTFSNPVLASGEMGIELDTKQFKIGDGTTRWSLLPYGGIQGPAGPAGIILPSTTPQIGQVLTYVGGSPSGIQWRNQLSYNTTTATIRASKAATNFDFTNVLPASIIPTAFGSGFTSGSDTDTFSIVMNSSYNLQNLPIITGTVAYWDNSAGKMFYMQMKFGNSSTSNSIAMTIEPTTPYSPPTSYGTPLRLTLSGITANAFTGVANIGASQLNYAIVIYLQLNN
jgi:hypothetical protein